MNIKQKYFLVFGIVTVLVIILISGCIQKQATEDKGEIAWEPKYPEEYIIYQDYLKTIGGVSGINDVRIIEGTVISITKSEACPDITDSFAPEPKECSIEPYPKDIGIVRIDKIIEYIPYSEQTIEQPVEEPSGAEEPSEGKTTPGYKGVDLPKPKPPEYEAFKIEQEVPTSFLLTTRPVKVRYVSIPPVGEPEPGPHGAMESEFEQLSEEHIGEEPVKHPITPRQEPVEHPLVPGEEPVPKTYKPIPKEGDYYVFTTKIIEYPETSQKILPGLKKGDKFRAKINYCGTLYVEEYEIIP